MSNDSPISDWDFFTKDPSTSQYRRDNSEWGRTHGVYLSPDGKAYVPINYYHWEFAGRFFTQLTGKSAETWRERSANKDYFSANEAKILEDLGWAKFSPEHGWTSVKKLTQSQMNTLWDILSVWDRLEDYDEIVRLLNE